MLNNNDSKCRPRNEVPLHKNFMLSTKHEVLLHKNYKLSGKIKQEPRGQIFSSDLMVAFFLFIIIFSAIIIFWNNMIMFSSYDVENRYIESLAVEIADTMVRTGGYPSTWENSNATTIGLAEWDRKIDSKKISAFIAMDYSQSKELMGIGGYDYFFRLVGANVTKGSLGGEVRVYTSRRIYYNGDDVLEFTLWK